MLKPMNAGKAQEDNDKYDDDKMIKYNKEGKKKTTNVDEK